MADPDPGCEKIRYGYGDNDTDPDPGKKDKKIKKNKKRSYPMFCVGILLNYNFSLII